MRKVRKAPTREPTREGRFTLRRGRRDTLSLSKLIVVGLHSNVSRVITHPKCLPPTPPTNTRFGGCSPPTTELSHAKNEASLTWRGWSTRCSNSSVSSGMRFNRPERFTSMLDGGIRRITFNPVFILSSAIPGKDRSALCKQAKIWSLLIYILGFSEKKVRLRLWLRGLKI